MENKWKIGARVSVIDEPLEGIIISVESHRITIEDEEGFTTSYPKNKLVLKEAIFINIDEHSLEEKHIEFIEESRDLIIETIDLHIDKLKIRHEHIEHPIAFQMSSLKEFIEDAKKRQVDRAIVIHGKGKGILKNTIISLINEFSDIAILPDKNSKSGSLTLEFSYPNR